MAPLPTLPAHRATLSRLTLTLARRVTFAIALALAAVTVTLSLTPTPATAQQQQPLDQILTPQDHEGILAQPWSEYGRVQTSGDWLALASPGAMTEEGVENPTGRVLLWHRENGLWVPRQVLRSQAPGSPSGNEFGRKVVMEGKRMVVSSLFGSEILHTYVLKAGVWVFDGMVTPPPGKDETVGSFGDDFALHGDTLAVSSTLGRVGMFDLGFVDIFQRTSAGWTHTARLKGTNPVGAPPVGSAVNFGYFLALTADTLYAAAINPSTASRLAIFKKTGATWVRAPDLIVDIPGAYLNAITLVPSGDRVFVGNSGQVREFSTRPPYALISQQTIYYNWQVRGNQTVSSGSEGVAVYRQTPGRGWDLDYTLYSNPDLQVWQITQAYLTGRELLVAGLDRAQGGTFCIRSLPRPTPLLEFSYSGDVTEQPPTPGLEDTTVGLNVGGRLIGQEVNPVVTLSVYLPPALVTGSTDPVPVNVSLTGGNDRFSLSTNRLVLQPGKKGDVKVSFKPIAAGGHRAVISFTVSGQTTPAARYEVAAYGVGTTSPMSFIRQPESGLYGPLEFRGLHVAVDSNSRPLTYRWLKNGAPVAGATGPSFYPKEGGRYIAEATNPRGEKVRSQEANVGFYGVLTPHVIAPMATPVRCAVAVSGPDITVKWRLEGVELLTGPDYAGTSTPVLTVKKTTGDEATLGGTYEATLSMPRAGGGGTLQATAQCNVYRNLPPVLDSFEGVDTYRVGDPVVTSASFTYFGPNVSTTIITYRGLPPGLRRTTSNGIIEGAPTTPGIYPVQVTLSVDGFTTTKTLKLTILPNGPPAGIYWGAIEAREGLADPGALMLDVTPTGVYTGLLFIGTTRTPLSGSLSTIPQTDTPERPLPVKIGGVSHLFWLRSTETPEMFQLMIRPVTSGTSQGFSQSSTGGFIGGIGSTGPGIGQFRAQEQSQPQSLSRKTQVHPDEDHLGFAFLIKPQAQPLPAENTGAYNFGLVSRTEDAELRGHGFGSLTIAASGRGSLVGQLPDGSALTGSLWATGDGTELYFHFADSRTRAVLYSTGGVPGDGGEVYWQRPPGTGRLYPLGFTQRPLVFYRSRYRPQTGQALLPSSAHQLELSAPDSQPDPTPVELTPRHTVRFAPGAGNPLQARLDIYVPTGFFSGQVTLRDPDLVNPERIITRIVQYRGMLLPDFDQGIGYFLLPGLPDAGADPPTNSSNTPIVSGSLLLNSAGK